MRHAVTAEKSGFDSVWLSEHHFAEDGYLPSPLVVMGALARETTAVDLATNVAIGPLYDPLRLAEDVAVVDQLSGGRVILGLGLGYRPEEFAALGVDRSRRGRILETTVCTLRAAWSGEAVVTDGRTGHAVPVRPLPAQTGGPPILLGAFASRGVRRAARIADGWIAPDLASVAQLARRLEILRTRRTGPAVPRRTDDVRIHRRLGGVGGGGARAFPRRRAVPAVDGAGR
nr:LLM class flavin-dependent oxidoreductase [Rhodococcus rhodochrous]